MTTFLLIIVTILMFVPRHTFLWRWIVGTLIGIDCTLNCLLLMGDYRETVSGRLGKAYLRGVTWITPFYWFVNILFLPVQLNLNHCLDSIDITVGDKTILRWK